uniref:Putative salivary lipocalin n=1 Tax=Ixodes ricinus TaxID=34613 RepID=A0A6B0V155_IXORI
MAAWLLLLLSHTTDAATTNPPWKNNEYLMMQNITQVIGVDETTYYVYEGIFDINILVQKRVFCLILRMSSFDVFMKETIAYRKYKEEMEQKRPEDLSLYLQLQRDSEYNVDNYMAVNDEYFMEVLAKMYLVYTDYSTCALFNYDEKDDYELWLYQKPKPDDIASACELLLALLSDKPRNVHYTNDCS